MDIADTILKLITYLGGGAVLVIGLSSWLGKVWASRILEKDRLKYQSQLEKYRDQLERQKNNYLRYSEYQFKLYNELWESLSDLQGSAEELWMVPDIGHLEAFTKQLIQTGKTVERKRILIEKDHYIKLLKILYAFKDFQIGKSKLLEFTQSGRDGSYLGINNNDIRQGIQIKRNQDTKAKYADLVNELANVFYKQVRQG